jgi:hypothetical protein
VSARRTEGSALDELVDGMDPLECARCLIAGDACHFHAGWAAGWDACAAYVAQVVERERMAELAQLDETEGVG